MSDRRIRTLFLAVFAALLASRLCHTGILWEGDGYPLAAARQMLHGRVLYRTLWFDKPPLLPLVYLLWGARDGWPLRLADTFYCLIACRLAFRFARERWSQREGMWAAALLAFFLIFDMASAVIPVASDLLMLAPHTAAVWLAWRGKSFWSGVMAGLACWISPKGIFVAAACVLWNPAGVLATAAGFAGVTAAAVGILAAAGALPSYWEQVWQWGRLYAASPFLESPMRNGAARTLNWMGFHAALAVAAACLLREKGRWRWIAWLLVAGAGVAAGLRFFPRYYFLLLPPLILMAARGFTLLGRRAVWIVLLLIIPIIRFGPPYLTALADKSWRDTAMDRDSRAAAAILNRLSASGDTLFVWGYRPELYVYTDLPAATRYLDSQPLSGVPADRHLTRSEPIETVEAARRRAELTHSRPSFLIDGLGPYNPSLAIGNYPDLHIWLSDYHEVAHTAGTVIYQAAPIP